MLGLTSPSESAPPLVPRPVPARDLLTIWYAPRATMRRVLDSGDYDREVHLIAIASGMLSALFGYAERIFGPDAPWVAIALTTVIAGPVLGIVVLYVSAMWVSVVGRMLGGEGTPEEARAAVAWGSVPYVAAWWLAAPALLAFQTLTRSFARGELAQATLERAALGAVVFFVAGSAGSLWSLATYTKCVAEAHRFSAWRALAIPVLTALLLVVVLLAAVGAAAVIAALGEL